MKKLLKLISRKINNFRLDNWRIYLIESDKLWGLVSKGDLNKINISTESIKIIQNPSPSYTIAADPYFFSENKDSIIMELNDSGFEVLDTKLVLKYLSSEIIFLVKNKK